MDRNPARIRRLSKAPIREALLDIRAKLPSKVDLATLEALHKGIEKDYPERNPIHRMEIGIKGQKGAPAFTERKHTALGYFLKNPDEHRMVQFRLDGFTFNWLHPYDTWKALLQRARPLFELYASATEPQSIARLALRYINVLSLPVGADFDDFLTAAPRAPNELPQVFASFISQVTIIDADNKCLANVTQSFDGVPDVSRPAPVTLDVDVYKQVEIDNWQDPDIWQVFEYLHEFKNRVFFSSITEETARLYE